MWHSYILNMRSVQASLVEISCLQGFHILTPVDPKWPLISTKKNRLLVLNVALLHTKYEICPSFPSWDIVFTRFLQCFHNLTPVDLKWPLTSTKNNRLLVLNVALLHTKYEICPSFPCWDIVFTRFSHVWPLLTPNDLWPPPKTIGFLFSMWHSYILNMRSVRASLLEISCLQGFYNVFTIWPLLTSNDLWPPPKTIGFLYSMWYTYIPNMRSVRASLLEISCLQAGVTTHTHTHTQTHTRQHEYKGYDYHRNQKWIR